MRGASALQEVLNLSPDQRMRVFVVWEPVLATDIAPASTAVMARVHDRRVAQYWDPKLLVSRELIRTAKADPSRLGKGEIRDVVWDAVAVYERGAEWTDGLPFPSYYGGPVVEVAEELRAALAIASSAEVPSKSPEHHPHDERGNPRQ